MLKREIGIIDNQVLVYFVDILLIVGRKNVFMDVEIEQKVELGKRQ